MKFFPEKREEILAKREKHRLMKSRIKTSFRPIEDDSPMVVRLKKLSEMAKKDK